jgi:hypothetical protein
VFNRYWLPAAASAAVSIVLAVPAYALSDHQRQFVSDVSSRGVNGDSVINGETQQTIDQLSQRQDHWRDG